MVTNRALIADYLALAKLQKWIAQIHRHLGQTAEANQAEAKRCNYIQVAKLLKEDQP